MPELWYSPSAVGSSVFITVTRMPWSSACLINGSNAASPGCPMTAMPSGLVAIACWNWVIILFGSQSDHWYVTSGPNAACAAFAPL
jgi:hypothetical protein